MSRVNTLKDSMQAAFNKSVSETLKQGRRASNPLGVCLYRVFPKDVNGKCLKCAIGHLLSDKQIEEYSIRVSILPLDFPGRLVEELIPGFMNAGCPTLVRNFLMDLQGAHDRSDVNFRSNFTAGALLVGQLYGLDTSFIPPVK